VAGAQYGHGPINAPGMEQVLADLDSKLENLGGANLEQVLKSFDTNAQAALDK
jgi:multiple sugar transport system substrate-binding protein